MAKKNTTSQKKKTQLYEPNKIAFGVAAVASLALVVFAIIMVTSVR